MRIAVCGSAVVDMVLQVESFPRKPEKHTAQRATLVGGGCAANAAVAIARLGGHLQTVTRSIGQQVEQELVDPQQRLASVGHNAVVLKKLSILLLLVPRIRCQFRIHGQLSNTRCTRTTPRSSSTITR